MTAAPGGCRRSVACAPATARRPPPRRGPRASARAARASRCRRQTAPRLGGSRPATPALAAPRAAPPLAARRPRRRCRRAAGVSVGVSDPGSDFVHVVPLSCAHRGRRHGDRQRQHLAPVSVVFDPLMCPCRSHRVQRRRVDAREGHLDELGGPEATPDGHQVGDHRGAVGGDRQRHDLRAHVVDTPLAFSFTLERQRRRRQRSPRPPCRHRVRSAPRAPTSPR